MADTPRIKLRGFGGKPPSNPLLEHLRETYSPNPLDPREIVINDESAIEITPLGKDTARLNTIRALEKGTGAGSRTLDLVGKLADRFGTTLEGSAKPFGEGGLDKQQLIEFYRRHGWVSSEDDPADLSRAPRTTDLVNLYHATPVKGPVDFGIGELGSHFADNPDLSRRAMKLLGHKDYRILEAKVNLGNVVTVPEQESFFGAEDLVTNLLDQGSITSGQASEFFDSIDRVQAGDHPAADRAWEVLEKAGIYGADALDKQAETEFLRPLLKKWGIDTIRYWNTYDAHGELGRFKDLESVAKELELGTQPSWSYIVVDPERVDSSKEHKPGVPAIIDAASVASQLARTQADDPRPKGLRGGLGSLKRAPWFALAQMFWENLTPKQREVAEQYGKDAYGSFEDAWKAASAWSRRNRFPTGVEGGLQWAMDLLGFSDSEPEEDSRLKTFQRLASQQRGDPEIAMVDAQKTMGGGVLNFAIEHTGDLTNRMAAEYDFFGGYGYDVGNKVDKVLRSLRSEYGFGKEYRENIRSNALSRGISEKEQQDASTKALQKYADAHKKLKVFNEPQKWARDAAVALGEQRFTDARELLSKLQDLIRGEGGRAQSGENISEAYRRAAGEFNPDFEDLKPERKASGGFVDRPLYEDARMVG